MHRLIAVSALLTLFAVSVATGAPVPGYFLEIESYDLSVDLQPEEDQIDVEATVVIVNRTFYEQATLDLYFNGAAEIRAATRDGQPVEFENVGNRGANERRLTFTLDPPLPVDETVTLTVEYTLVILERGGAVQIEPGSTFVLTEVRWTPYLHTHDGDHGSDYAPVRMEIKVPAGETAVMPGNLLESEEGLRQTRSRWESRLSLLPVIVSGRYRIVEETSESGTRAQGYLLEDMGDSEEAAMRILLKQALQIYEIYEAMLGPLPDEPLRIVAVDRRGGYGLPRCLLLNRGTFGFVNDPGRDILDFLAHEIAHSWFPGLLRPRARARGMMSEALATYLATLAIGELLGDEAATDVWRQHQSVYASVREDDPLIDQGPGSRTYGISTYRKGANWWRTLERLLGRERLLGLLRDFAQSHSEETVPFDELFEWINEETPDVDLQPAFRWCLETSELTNVGVAGPPRATATETGVHVEIPLITEGLEGLPFDITLQLEDGSTIRETAEISSRGSLPLELDLPSAPVEIALDPEAWLFQSHYRDDRWPREQDAAGFYQEAAAAWRGGDFEAGLEPIAQALARQEANPQFHLMAGLLLLGVEDHAAASRHLQRALDLVPEEETSLTRAWALVTLGRVEHALEMRHDARGHWSQVSDTDETREAFIEAQRGLRALEREIDALTSSD